MKKTKPNYNKIALIVSLVALLAAALAGLLRGVIALGLYIPDDMQPINLTLIISGSLTVLGLAVYTILEPDRVREFLGGRQARYGSNALLLSLAFAGIVIVVNYLFYENRGKVIDMTEDAQNTLAPETIAALENLPGKMTATAFFSEYPRDEAQRLLDNMKSNSNDKFDYRFVDPVANPLEAKQYGITGDGKIALELNGRHEIVSYADEAEFLRAMNRLLNPQEYTVYFLAGHGEHDPSGGSDPASAFSRARETLENKNYTVQTLNLLAENRVPEDAQAVIIAGPSKPLTAAEVGLLNKYTQQGGALVIMEDPVPLTDFGDAPDPLAESLERVWGIRLRNDFVVDLASTEIQNAYGTKYDASHPVTRALNTQGFYTVFPLARSIELKPQEGVTQTSLVETDPRSKAWGETDFAVLKSGGGNVELDPALDTAGPLILAAAGENQTGGRVVVIGNSHYATDQNFDVYGNGDLFVYSVDWAVGQQASIDITPKDITQRTFMPPGQLAQLGITLGVICVLPGLVIAGGIAAWLSRKRRG